MAKHVRVEIIPLVKDSLHPLLAFILRSRKRRKHVIIIPNTTVHRKIFEGTKFSYKKFDNRYVIWSVGPFQAEIVILVRHVRKYKDFHLYFNKQPLNGDP